MIPSPVPAYNYDPVPTITRVDDFWYRKYGETKDGKLVRIAETEDVVQKRSDGKHIHLPSPSYWPIVVAFGLPIVAYGLIFSLWLCVPGGLIVVGGIFGWVLEPPDDPDAAAPRPRSRRPRVRRRRLPSRAPPASCRAGRGRRRSTEAATEADKEAETVG